jgi:hypothetical protein
VDPTLAPQLDRRVIQPHVRDGCQTPLPVIVALAKNEDWDWSRQSTRQSFVRAAVSLARRGLIDIWYLTLPTAWTAVGRPTNHRQITCLCRADLAVDDEQFGGARAIYWAMFEP